ncbi:tRNA-guanine transglycosylase [Halarsenatibacter silvermanii]|uniref:Queuine tRNA-ribosyltransferase n=2 Tax=Halarsenatibacter silvermanii TaxID=321763 RepID=A0A1G9JS94_9FIRM|nr:tRNA-guanine transglycosylase [Halarsenatibacter silvermanii]
MGFIEMTINFSVESRSSDSPARTGTLELENGMFETPIFMPVGTRATVKSLSPEELKKCGTGILLANTYHLYLRPGADVVAEAGGLHEFMNWSRPILTDSGGFQVFSLSDMNEVTEDGVQFQSHLDGSKHFITPEKSVEIQKKLGADIIMAFDECVSYPADREYVEKSLNRTLRWAERSLKAAEDLQDHQHIFGIVQGGTYPDLRKKSARRTRKLDFPGYAIGGLSVGEENKLMYQMLDVTVPELPSKKPRYLMGVGTPRDLIEGVKRGVDMFDCVLPTRLARHGSLYTSRGRINITNAAFKKDFNPPDKDCSCYVCRNYSSAYLRHLIKRNELYGLRLASYHNLYFFLDLMRKLRYNIRRDTLDDFVESFYSGWAEE